MAPSTAKLVGSAAPPAYSTEDVARMIGRSTNRLLRSVRRLHADNGMPLPLAGRPYRWDRARFDAWRAGQRPAPAPANDVAARDADTDTWRAALAAEYGTS